MVVEVIYGTFLFLVLLWNILKFIVILLVRLIILIGKGLAMIFMLPGTKYSGDWEAKETYHRNYYEEYARQHWEEFEPPEEKAKVEDCYEILGVSAEDDLATIKQVYRSLSKAYHPDVNKSKRAEEKIKKINDAWSKIQKLKS